MPQPAGLLITLFTDSSYSHTLRRATWAAWYRADGVTHRQSGALKGRVENSGEGELGAIANALHCIRKTYGQAALAGARIIIQADSEEALQAVERRSHPRASAQSIVDYILDFQSGYAVTLDIRHVKAHVSRAKRTRRNAVNHWCDREAKRQMGLLLASAEASAVRMSASAPPSLSSDTVPSDQLALGL